ncbi:MAG: GNAT family N-acetyltransferase [Proteobacteria bacterium]|nr:GNAT family N-acetyltransferase [Pseudomonadota bacterium]
MTREADIRIRYLADTQDALATLVDWFVDEWRPYYGSDGPGNAEADLRESMNRDALPICLVAATDAGDIAGCISLKSESISHPELTPWGAAFLVAPTYRRQGIGTMLVAALEKEARRLGFSQLYMSTDAATRIVERRGWRAFDTTESLRGTITVYSVYLESELPNL